VKGTPGTLQEGGVNQTLCRPLSIALTLLLLSVFINYVDRGNLSIAAPLLKSELDISASQLGILLSAFFWTYTAMLFICGWFVDQFVAAVGLGTGNLAGVTGPALSGFTVDWTGHFQVAIEITAAVCLLGAIVWLFRLGEFKEVAWAQPAGTLARPVEFI